MFKFNRVRLAAASLAMFGTALIAPTAFGAVQDGASNCVAVHKYKKAYISQQRVYQGKHQFKVTTPVVWVCDGKIVGIAGGSTTPWHNFLP